MPAKPDMEFAWAESPTYSTEPSDAKKQLGWVAEQPPVEWMNWVQNRMDTFLQHINERGIPAWDTDTTYLIGAKAYESGITYVAQIENDGNQPSVDDGTNWKEDTGGMIPPIEIVNIFSETTTQTAIGGDYNEILSGALTADTYKTLLEINPGSGIAQLIAVITKDATSRVLTLKVTIDGTVAFEAPSSTITANSTGIICVGRQQSDTVIIPVQTSWDTSLKVEVKSSLTETDKVALLADYYLT